MQVDDWKVRRLCYEVKIKHFWCKLFLTFLILKLCQFVFFFKCVSLSIIVVVVLSFFNLAGADV